MSVHPRCAITQTPLDVGDQGRDVHIQPLSNGRKGAGWMIFLRLIYLFSYLFL